MRKDQNTEGPQTKTQTEKQTEKQRERERERAREKDILTSCKAKIGEREWSYCAGGAARMWGDI